MGEHAGRKTIKGEDIRLARKRWDGGSGDIPWD
jgi:histone H3/H4